MKKLESMDIPNGWLIDPHSKWAIHFESKRGSNDDKGNDYNIDMWGVLSNGKPMEFKSRRKATKLDSINTWKQLISSDWVELDISSIKTA